MPPSFQKPREWSCQRVSTRRLSTLDSLPKDSSSPEENSFDVRLLPTKEMRRRRLPGIQIPTGARALSIRLASWPVAAFVVASCSGANQNANETGLPCPAETCASCARFRLGLRQDHRPNVSAASAARTIGFLLAAHSPAMAFESRLRHRRTGYQSGGHSGSCVSQLLRNESSVGELVSQPGNHASRWGRQALLLDSGE